ncbi:hypothetical protein BAUCODRAFT_148274 [Baudoinia panamericana UAMH 10762]|uniref:Uncharacterized protein n=1 Tax=Baudoinia panamericana (strain UAMH 10762) TaxID=717646 RepID=M2NC15_BAUPA|nr:uncharacterized protein BAUCODRAFT_148274 [Baudoinia panamericana UAMH 10762]EMC96709.1 hypothetical protein BAUCODRAFT_148274 [Baudoinia panamericana UAMH 10762]
MAARNLHATILGLEEETWRALQKAGADLLPYITRDCIMQFPMGLKVTSTSDPSIEDILYSSAFVPWKTFRMSKVDVQHLGPEGAIISYFVHASRPPAGPNDVEDIDFEALCSSAWRFEAGKWMMCFHQQTLAT